MKSLRFAQVVARLTIAIYTMMNIPDPGWVMGVVLSVCAAVFVIEPVIDILVKED